MDAGLERGGFELLNADHFWGNCESLWSTVSLCFWVTANHFWPIVNHFSNGFAKKPFFGHHSF